MLRLNKPIVPSTSYLSRAVLPGKSLVGEMLESPNVDKISIIADLDYALDGIFPAADFFSAFFVNIFKRTVKISSQYKI